MDVLDGDIDDVFTLHGRLPQTLVLAVLAVENACAHGTVVGGGDVDLREREKMISFLLP